MLGITSFFFNLLRKILFLWVRTDVIGNDAKQLGLDPEKPVVYVLQHSSLSSRLVLEQECRLAGLPSSQAPLTLRDAVLSRSHFFLYEKRGQMFRRRHTPIITERLKQLVSAAQKDPGLDVQIVPVSLFWGRTPEKERSLFKLMLADTWSIAGRLRQFLTIMIHGRNTFIQFSKPISLRYIVDDTQDPQRANRKLARLLRVHFRRMRQAVVGPDLSHRRTLVSTLIRSPAVKDAIRETAKKENIPPQKAKERARKYADEIASNVSIAAVRFLDIILTWVWNKIYNGVNINNIDAVKEAAKSSAVVYVPCHRSHIDYLLLSYVLYRNGLMVPHIAAGINLNMPVVGPILRRGGAFFMRRSFKNNKLYTAVFNEYMHSMFTRGHPVEYFVEGGRSRTGRTLQPKAGMLMMTVRSYLRNYKKPITFVPVYIGYEKILEARSYLGELRGKKKKDENIFGLFKSLRNLRNSFGRVSVNFGEPFALSDVLDKVQPHWRDQAYDQEARPKWMPHMIDELAEMVATRINNAAALNPINIVATLLLATPKQAMDEKMLADHCDAVVSLLRMHPYSNEMSFPEGCGADWVKYTESMGLALRQHQKLGDIISLEGSSAILLTYYRNNILHFLALPALVASLFQNNSTMDRTKLVWLVSSIYPYIKSELFLRWHKDDVDPEIERWIETLCESNLLLKDKDNLYRPMAGSREFVLLNALAKTIIPTLERYYISIAILRRHGKGAITANALEEQSTSMAERMSILYGLNAPEFFDKALFRNFINNLKSNEIIQVDEEGHIVYDEDLDNIAEDARLVLNAELRQSILQVAIETQPTQAPTA
ncbi:glycerol-3-phosphate 1-O-acyltransferase PlsB [Hahella sp. CR1]|uniref:glycerol-3-phosphate 1-O-acyltransferase PlsB n=1 Tax=Hahella sp. CR1 TaxID=2992807 RepID=UPI002442784A|nr:glycerol-3-phosphate 1-O-acyltransferase PlsB [Hahella sp. CR1]MDG9668423.1 glycerol-3-phosphate 1-O-acyltransferase PlsB [Hahella sp. CR1]